MTTKEARKFINETRGGLEWNVTTSDDLITALSVISELADRVDEMERERTVFKPVRVFVDGNQHCAVGLDFVNMQESPAGFGDTAEDAVAELVKQWHGEGGGQVSTTPHDVRRHALPVAESEIMAVHERMTLRDELAAKAMHSINIQPKVDLHTNTPMWGIRARDVVKRAYEIADAMLAARKGDK